MEKNLPAPQKISLSRALESIAEILAIAEEGLNDEQAINDCLAVADSQLADSVDRRVGLVSVLSGGTLSIDAAKGLIASLKAQEDAVYRERKILEKMLLRIKQSTMELMEAHGYESLKGAVGEFRMQAGAPSLVLDVPTYSRSYSCLVAPTDTIGIPSEYLTYEQIATIRKDAIKEDLLKGAEIPWARLQFNKQIRMKSVLPQLR